MDLAAGANFRHLNVGNTWPGFSLSGLVIGPDGALTLAPVPAAGAQIGDWLELVPALAGPVGVAADPAGNVYIADPAQHRVLRVDGCDGAVAPLPCLAGPGSEPGQLDRPRGLVVGPRRALYVADSGNHRIQVVDLGTGQIRAVWGQPDPWAPSPGTAPGRLDDPWDLAADPAGFVYVADHGNARVQKFDPDGRVWPDFAQTMATGPQAPVEPSYVAVIRHLDTDRLLVLDRGGPAGEPSVGVFDLDGGLDEPATGWWRDLPLHPDSPLMFVDGALYVGDPGGGRVLAFDAKGRFLGVAAGFRGPARYLALDHKGRLLVHPGGAGAVTGLDRQGAYATGGWFETGAVSTGEQRHLWHRLVAGADLPPGTHLRLSARVGDDPAQPPAADDWMSLPQDALDALLPTAGGRYLWLRGELAGDGTATPVLHQIRVSFDHEGYLRHLPALFREPAPGGFLERVLALLESHISDAEDLIDGLPRLFDPVAAPDGPAPSWLGWLATWLSLPLPESWPPARRRAAFEAAFDRHGQRGTLAALREQVNLYADTAVEIIEPGRQVAVWALGETSVLGRDTMLATADPQGAALGSTAVADRSHLIDEAVFGQPLFAGTAHRFCVRLRARPGPPDRAVEQVRMVLDREKPAHTSYHLCLVGDQLRVGIQAQVGMDTYVAGPPAGVLPHDRARAELVGRDTRVGRTTTS